MKVIHCQLLLTNFASAVGFILAFYRKF